MTARQPTGKRADIATRNGQPARAVAQANGDERQRPAVTLNQWRAARYAAPAPFWSFSGLATRLTGLIGQ